MDNLNKIIAEAISKEPPLKTLNLNPLKLTSKEIKALTDEDLFALLNGEKYKGIIPLPIMQSISNELLIRQIEKSSKPHWTVTPTFIVSCIAAIASIISIVLTIYFSVNMNNTNTQNNNTNQSNNIKNDTSH